MYLKGHLYFDMFVKFIKFLKNNLENIELLSSTRTFSNGVNWRRCELPRSSFEYRFTHFRIISIHKFFYLNFCSYMNLNATKRPFGHFDDSVGKQ